MRGRERERERERKEKLTIRKTCHFIVANIERGEVLHVTQGSGQSSDVVTGDIQ